MAVLFHTEFTFDLYPVCVILIFLLLSPLFLLFCTKRRPSFGPDILISCFTEGSVFTGAVYLIHQYAFRIMASPFT